MHDLIMISCQLSSSGSKHNHPIVCVGRPKQSGQLHTPEFFLAVAGLTTCTVNKVTEPALGNCKTASHRDRQTGSHYLFLSTVILLCIKIIFMVFFIHKIFNRQKVTSIMCVCVVFAAVPTTFNTMFIPVISVKESQVGCCCSCHKRNEWSSVVL